MISFRKIIRSKHCDIANWCAFVRLSPREPQPRRSWHYFFVQATRLNTQCVREFRGKLNFFDQASFFAGSDDHPEKFFHRNSRVSFPLILQQNDLRASNAKKDQTTTAGNNWISSRHPPMEDKLRIAIVVLISGCL